MKTSELIEKLQQFPSELEIRIMNVAIGDDESCPTFEIGSISLFSDDNILKKTDKDCAIIQFEDKVYIQDSFNITN